MPPQEVIKNPQPIQSTVESTPSAPRRMWLTVLLIIGYVLSVLVGIGIVGGMGIGCMFGSSGFMCQRLLPFSIGVGIMLIVLLFLHISKTTRRLVRMIYWIAFLIWVALIGLISILPDSARQTYVYGITREACETGRPSVPWGYVYSNPDTCFSTVGECLSMKSYSDYCFDKSTTQKITEVGQCDRFENGSSECVRDFAIKSKDVSYCKDLKSPYKDGTDIELAWERYSCAQDVASGYNHISSEIYDYVRPRMLADDSAVSVISKQEKYGREFCGKYEGLQKDVCLFQASNQPEYITGLCKDIQIDWLKKECIVYVSDKVPKIGQY